MPADMRLRVVLCWHMHQPEYRDPLTGHYLAPWSYLHGLKDYTDMVAHLENEAGATAVVNFSPLLLDQLQDYNDQLESFFSGGGGLRDPLLAALAQPALPVAEDARRTLVQACLKLQRRQMVERFPAFRRLAEMADWMLDRPESFNYLDAAMVGDLLVWYHLAWLGETVRRSDPRAAQFIQKERGYTADDRRDLLLLIRELLSGVIGRYRALAEQARVEISMNPYAHPILPLLLDFRSAREARPALPLPATEAYPGGEERARRHLEWGRRVHMSSFGTAPTGCWPSEGALSEATLALLDAAEFRWAASSQRVLLNSLGLEGAPSEVTHRIYRLGEQRTALFFRDDELSDLIGFQYKDWHADDAVADLVSRLAAIASEPQAGPGRVVTIALDGENAWEHYPENGYHFLSALYRVLSQDARFELTTFSRCLDDPEVRVGPLPRLTAGSWVHGDLTTWIGHPDKNRAWDMLAEARRCYIAALDSGQFGAPERERLERQLAVCEGSDWFWWPGEYNPQAAVSHFEFLFRTQLAGLYHLLGEAPPDYLGTPFSHGSAQATGGVMRPGR
ncbi:MAG: glycoside hydrolase [Bacillota bacterium]